MKDLKKIKAIASSLFNDSMIIRKKQNDLFDSLHIQKMEAKLNALPIEHPVVSRGISRLPTEDDWRLGFSSSLNQSDYEVYTLINNLYKTNLQNAILLNKMLDKPIKKILDIEQIQKKEFITADEFTLLYGYSKQWQTQRRSRLYNALEVVSLLNKKVLYNSETVKKVDG